jgi:hypothetical protein
MNWEERAMAIAERVAIMVESGMSEKEALEKARELVAKEEKGE